VTSNLRWAQAPGNVLLPARTTGLDKDSVANVSQIISIDRSISHNESRPRAASITWPGAQRRRPHARQV